MRCTYKKELLHNRFHSNKEEKFEFIIKHFAYDMSLPLHFVCHHFTLCIVYKHQEYFTFSVVYVNSFRWTFISNKYTHAPSIWMCVCSCACVRVRVPVCVCMCVCVSCIRDLSYGKWKMWNNHLYMTHRFNVTRMF